MDALSTADQSTDWRSKTRESRLGTILVLVVTAVVVAAAAYVVQRPKADDAATGVQAVTLTGADSPAPIVGSTPADFSARTVDGRPVSLASLKGHPVWLTFGASWCAACVAEAPDIEAAYEKAKAGGAVVVQVFINEDPATVKDFAQRVGLTYTAVADPATTVASAYRVLGIPAHFFIDRTGVLRDVRTGSMTPADMDAALQGVS